MPQLDATTISRTGGPKDQLSLPNSAALYDKDINFILSSLATLPTFSLPSSPPAPIKHPDTPCTLIREIIQPPLAHHTPQDTITPIIAALLRQYQSNVMRSDYSHAQQNLTDAKIIFRHPEIWSSIETGIEWQSALEADQTYRKQYERQVKEQEQQAAMKQASQNRPAKLDLADNNNDATSDNPDGADADGDNNNSSTEEESSAPAILLSPPSNIPPLSAETSLIYEIYFCLSEGDLCLSRHNDSNNNNTTELLALRHSWSAWCYKMNYIQQQYKQRQQEQHRQKEERQAARREMMLNNNQQATDDEDDNEDDDHNNDTNYDRGQTHRDLDTSRTSNQQQRRGRQYDDYLSLAINATHSTPPCQITPFNLPSPMDGTIFNCLALSATHLHHYHTALALYQTSLYIQQLTIPTPSSSTTNKTPLASSLYIDLANTLHNMGVVLSYLQYYDLAYTYLFAAQQLMIIYGLSHVHPRYITIIDNISRLQSCHHTIQDNSMMGLMRGVQQSILYQEQEQEIARQNRAAQQKKGGNSNKDNNNKTAKSVTTTNINNNSNAITLTPSIYPPIKDFYQDRNFFLPRSLAYPMEESKDNVSFFDTMNPMYAAANTTTSNNNNTSSSSGDAVWLRSWSVQATEFEKLMIQNIQESESKIKENNKKVTAKAGKAGGAKKGKAKK